MTEAFDGCMHTTVLPRTQFLSIADLAPALIELVGANSAQTHIGGRTVRAIIGRSWVPWLRDAKARIYGPEEAVDAELPGSRAWRQGEWKLTDIGDGAWRLFHIVSDPGRRSICHRTSPSGSGR